MLYTSCRGAKRATTAIIRLDMSPYSSKLADTASRPAERSRWRTWNQGWAILTPRSLASLLRAMQAPSLEDSTTTGRPHSRGWKTRSQLTYMLLASTRANMASDLSPNTTAASAT